MTAVELDPVIAGVARDHFGLAVAGGAFVPLDDYLLPASAADGLFPGPRDAALWAPPPSGTVRVVIGDGLEYIRRAAARVEAEEAAKVSDAKAAATSNGPASSAAPAPAPASSSAPLQLMPRPRPAGLMIDVDAKGADVTAGIPFPPREFLSRPALHAMRALLGRTVQVGPFYGILLMNFATRVPAIRAGVQAALAREFTPPNAAASAAAAAAAAGGRPVGSSHVQIVDLPDHDPDDDDGGAGELSIDRTSASKVSIQSVSLQVARAATSTRWWWPLRTTAPCRCVARYPLALWRA